MFGITVICRFWSLIFSLITLTVWGAQKNYVPGVTNPDGTPWLPIK